MQPVVSTPATPELMTAEEVSALLRLPLSTVYYLAKTGRLPATQFGRSWRFPAQEIDRLLAGRPGTVQVLIVDDDEVTRMMVVDGLQGRNCVVVEAGSVDEGLAATRRRRFDVLFIDFKMPGKDGTELIRALQGEYSLNQMVVITAFPDLAEMETVFELGAVTLIRKPFSVNQMVACVERITGKILAQR